MDTPSRRTLLRVGGVGLFVALGGCAGDDGAGTPAHTPSPMDDPPASPMPLGRPPADLLPEARDGWSRESRRRAEMALGDVTGWRATYLSPEGVRFEALVLRDVVNPTEAGRNAEWLAREGWQVTLAHEELTYAASSGTEVGTRTPETPIVMDRTPVPGTAGDAVALLALAPRLSASVVEERRVS